MKADLLAVSWSKPSMLAIPGYEEGAPDKSAKFNVVKPKCGT